jgi:hypothetical protein
METSEAGQAERVQNAITDTAAQRPTEIVQDGVTYYAVPDGLSIEFWRAFQPALEALLRSWVGQQLTNLPVGAEVAWQVIVRYLNNLWIDGALRPEIEHLVTLPDRPRFQVVAAHAIRDWHTELSPELQHLKSAPSQAGAQTGNMPAPAFTNAIVQPPHFAGPTAGNPVDRLLEIARWVDAARTTANLLNLRMNTAMVWVRTFLQDSAYTYVAGLPADRPLSDFEDLQRRLVQHFVGNDPYDLLWRHVQNVQLTGFADFPTFRLHFQNAVQALRASAGADRQLPDFVLVDALRQALKPTAYAETLLRDPVTGASINSVARAMQLLEEKHASLEIRGAHYLKRSLRDVQGSQAHLDKSMLVPRPQAAVQPETATPAAKKPRQAQAQAQAQSPAPTPAFGARPRILVKERPRETEKERIARWVRDFSNVEGVTVESVTHRVRNNLCILCESADENHSRAFARYCPIFKEWKAVQKKSKNAAP